MAWQYGQIGRGILNAYMQGVELKQKKEAMDMQQQNQLAAQQFHQAQLQQQQNQFDTTLGQKQTEFAQTLKLKEGEAKLKESDAKLREDQARTHFAELVKGRKIKGDIDPTTGEESVTHPTFGKFVLPSAANLGQEAGAIESEKLKATTPAKVAEKQAMLPVEVEQAGAQAAAVSTAQAPMQQQNMQVQAGLQEDKAVADQARALKRDELRDGRLMELTKFREKSATNRAYGVAAIRHQYKMAEKETGQPAAAILSEDIKDGKVTVEDIQKFVPAKERLQLMGDLKKQGIAILDNKELTKLDQFPSVESMLKDVRELRELSKSFGNTIPGQSPYWGKKAAVMGFLGTLKAVTGSDHVLSEGDRKALIGIIPEWSNSKQTNDELVAKFEKAYDNSKKSLFGKMSLAQRKSLYKQRGLDPSLDFTPEVTQ